MARSDHSRMTRNPSKRTDQERRTRQDFRRQLALGEYDLIAGRMPARAIRTTDFTSK